MRRLLVLTLLLNIVLVLVALAVLPDRVATHFGPGGMADAWTSKTTHAAIFLIIMLPIFGMFYWSDKLLEGINPSFISLPNRDYWLSAGNLPRAQAILGDQMATFGVATFLLLLAANGLTIDANFRDPAQLREWLFLPIFGVYMIYVVVWCVGLLRAFRVPSA